MVSVGTFFYPLVFCCWTQKDRDQVYEIAIVSENGAERSPHADAPIAQAASPRRPPHAGLGCVGAAPAPPIGPAPCMAESIETRLDMHRSLGGPLAPTLASASASC